MITKGKMLIGVLIGFASGLYLASTFFTAFFSGRSFAATSVRRALFLFFRIVMSIFSFFGVHCMSDNNKSKIEEELEC